MGRGAEAGKADDSVDTDASTAPKMSGETGDAPSASETTESHGGRPPSGAGASTSFENGQKGVHRPGLVRRFEERINRRKGVREYGVGLFATSLRQWPITTQRRSV